MNKSEIVDLLQTIKGAYGYKFDINEFTSKVWHDALKQKSFEDARNLLTNHINKEDYPPTISAFLRNSSTRQVNARDERTPEEVEQDNRELEELYAARAAKRNAL